MQTYSENTSTESLNAEYAAICSAAVDSRQAYERPVIADYLRWFQHVGRYELPVFQNS